MVSLSANSASGAAVYSRFFLSYIYDNLVLYFSNSYVWRCPTKQTLLRFFTRNLSHNHLDIGVGTGYYLQQASASGALTKDSKIWLADFNLNSLEAAQMRLTQGAGLRASTLLWDVMTPLPLFSPESEPIKFDSISLFYLLHCLPAPTSYKTSIFAHLRQNLSPEGVLYGATILGEGNGVKHNMIGRFLMWLYNWRGIFDNVKDSEEEIVGALRDQFEEVKTSVVGVVLLFTARLPKVEGGRDAIGQ